MHGSVIEWVAGLVEAHGLAPLDVLEVGSLDVNGSVRHLFTGPYLGVDMRSGPGVDRVVTPGEPLPWPHEVVISTEALEHDPCPWLTFPSMAAACTGWLIVTARGIGFPLHDHPSDYWRFTVEGFRRLAQLTDLTEVEVIPDPDPASPGVFGVWRRG